MSDIVDFDPGHIKTADDFPFLSLFERRLDVLKEAYAFLVKHGLLQQMPGLAERKSIQADHWYLFPIYVNCNNDAYLDFLSAGFGVDVREFFADLRVKLPALFGALDEALSRAPIINVTFMRMRPGATLRVHADSGDFQHRLHVGVNVPAGNCGIRVKDTVAKWREGRSIVFDATQPHVAWNLTEHDRVVLSVDVFKEPLERSRREHLVEMQRKMQTSPLGFDGGGYRPLDQATVTRFNRVVELVDYGD